MFVILVLLRRTLLLSNGIRALLVSDPTPVPHCGLTSSSSSSSYDSTGDSCAEESSSTSSEDEESMSTSTTDNGESDSDLESEEGKSFNAEHPLKFKCNKYCR